MAYGHPVLLQHQISTNEYIVEAIACIAKSYGFDKEPPQKVDDSWLLDAIEVYAGEGSIESRDDAELKRALDLMAALNGR